MCVFATEIAVILGYPSRFLLIEKKKKNEDKGYGGKKLLKRLAGDKTRSVFFIYKIYI